MLDEDCDLNYEVESCLAEHEQFNDKIDAAMSKCDKTERKVNVTDTLSKCTGKDTKTQLEVLTYIYKRDNAHKSSVKQPKLDFNIFMFYGDKVNWCNVWPHMSVQCTGILN